jgi:hypothetical protein
MYNRPFRSTDSHPRISKADDEDLSANVAKMSYFTALKSYAPDWLLAVVLW